ncbi:hypothetical protein ACHAWF_001190, partial [Thalassiosira exigua]
MLVAKRTPSFNPQGNSSVELLELPRRHGLAKAIKAAFELIPVATPCVLAAQHDNFFVQDVAYLPRMLRFLEREETEAWLSCVHFPSTEGGGPPRSSLPSCARGAAMPQRRETPEELAATIEEFVNDHGEELPEKLKGADDFFANAFGVSADGRQDEVKEVVA